MENWEMKTGKKSSHLLHRSEFVIVCCCFVLANPAPVFPIEGIYGNNCTETQRCYRKLKICLNHKKDNRKQDDFDT